MVLMVCFVFSSGMPLFMFIGSGYFAITFFVDKHTLLRKSSRSTKIDASLNNWVSS